MRICTWAALLLAGATLAAAEPLQTAGKIDAITVYRGQALVTRIIPLSGPAGLREIVVTGLPEHIVPGSLYAEANDDIEVRSVRYRLRPASEDVREEVRKLDEQIRDIQDKLAANERMTQLAGQRTAYLDRLEQFTAATANVELSRGILNADTLEKLSTFIFTQRRELVEEQLRLAIEQRNLGEQLQLLQRQRQELTRDSSRAQREATVFVNQRAASAGQFRLRYLVNEATWSPSYSIRAAAERNAATVEYNAAIQQMSGEDWTDVAMTLSTATPSLVAKAPELTTLTIGLAAISGQAGEPGKRGSTDYAASRRELQQQQRMVQAARGNQPPAPPPPPPPGEAAAPSNRIVEELWPVDVDAELNKVANQMQVLDLVARGKIVAERDAGATARTEGYSVTYAIAARTTLPSRSDQQLIQIAALPMKGQFYKVAIPVLTNYVYEEATVANDSALVLLAGPVSTYLADQFVGHSTIPTVAAGEKFTVGFGIDSALRASRELIERKESVQGGNRILDFTYRLTIDNFGSAGAVVRLLERLPTAKGSEIKVTLTSAGKEPLAENSQKNEKEKKGMLRWDVQVPAQQSGGEALTLEYQFRLEYDKQMAVTELASAAP